MAQFNLQNYEEVKDRIPRFFAKYPSGRIITSLEHHAQEFGKVIFKASVYDGEILIATGWGYEEKLATGSGVNRDAWVENCETSAIGRALANLGMNGDKPRPSREEMAKVQKMQEPSGNDDLVNRIKKAKASNIPDVVKLIDAKRAVFYESKREAQEKIVEEIETLWATMGMV